MLRRTLRSQGFAALLVLVLGLCPVAAAAEDTPDVSAAPAPDPTAWDQERAASQAADLDTALSGLRDALRNEPSASIVPGGGSMQRHRIRDRLRVMENESRFLAEQLKGGSSRDETLPVFERIDLIRRDAVEDARRIFLSKPVLDKIDAARGPLEELAKLYGVELRQQMPQR
jgi:hypothetical protein